MIVKRPIFSFFATLLVASANQGCIWIADFSEQSA